MDNETCLHDGETYNCSGFNGNGEPCVHCSLCSYPTN